MSWKVDDIPVFAAVVGHGGITAASKVLGTPKSSVSIALSRLEQGLGVRLVHRSSRSLRLTEEGETFYRHAQRILEQVKEASSVMAGLTAEPAGRLTVALPPAFAEEIVAPRLSSFQMVFPKVQLELIVTADGIPLLRDLADLAVVVGPLEDSELIARRLVLGPLVWVCSPDYFRTNEVGPTVEELRSHIWLCEKRYGQARMAVRVNGRATHIDLSHGISHVNDPLVVRRAVIGGAGISPLPLHYCRGQISTGELIQVGQHIKFDTADSTLTAVHLSRHHVSPRVREFLEFLTRSCKEVTEGVHRD